MNILYLVIEIIISITIIILAIVLFKVRKKKDLEGKKINWMKAQKYTLLHILVPKDNEKKPVSAEQMFASLHGIFKPDAPWQEQISLEIIARNKHIHFYISVPTHYKEFVEGQIYAQYPTVEIHEAEDYTNDEELINQSTYVGCELKLNKNDVYPIKTFLSFDVDPLAAITSVLSETKDKEQIWIQIICRPVSDQWQDRGIKFIDMVRAGKAEKVNAYSRFMNFSIRAISEFIRIATSRPAPETKEGSAPEIKLSGPQEAALKAVEEKITKLGFNTKIRVLAFSEDEHTARAKCGVVGGAFKQFNTTNLNGFEITVPNKSKELYRSYAKREFFEDGYVLNIEELASIYHLPSVSVETPNIVWAGSKKGEPPADLPIEGSTAKDDLTIFAKSDFRHLVHRFGIKKDDRRLHMYAVGKTGTGKSTLLENMVIDDIIKGRGLAVVDPHGDLINHVMNFIPNSRVNDVVYFNPADRDWPIGFNILESVDPDLKSIVASGVVGIFKKIFGESWGPRLEYILRNTIVALLDYPDSTMLGIMKLLIDKDYRNKVVDHVKDPVIRDFFLNEYEKYDPKFRTEAIAPIQNKVGQFLSSATIRNIVGQPKSSIDIEQIMNEGKILLIDLSLGKIGEDNSALLGAMMITKIQLAAMRRANIPEEKRKDFYLYVDEFQNFATESFAVILSEARKYRLCLIMTNQFIAQMNETVAKAIFGNVGSIVSFRVGATDASFLNKEFEPVFEPNDLVNLDNYHVYIKMAIDGVTRPAFSAITLPPSKGETTNLEKIIRVSRERYTKPREFVEAKIKSWSDEGKSSQDIHANKSDQIRKFLYDEKQGKRHTSIDGKLYNKFIDKKGEMWYEPKPDNIQKNDQVEKTNEKEKVKTNEKVAVVEKTEQHIKKQDIPKKIERDTKELKSIIGPILEKRFKAKKDQMQKKNNESLITIEDIKKDKNVMEVPKSNNDTKILEEGESINFD